MLHVNEDQPVPQFSIEAPPLEDSQRCTSPNANMHRRPTDANLLSPEASGTLFQQRRLSPPPAVLNNIGMTPGGAPSLVSKATILHRQAALASSRMRVHGMFTGNAAHELSRTMTAQQPMSVGSSHHLGTTAGHFGLTHALGTGGGGGGGAPWSMKRRLSGQQSSLPSRGPSMLATPADPFIVPSESSGVFLSSRPSPSTTQQRRSTPMDSPLFNVRSKNPPSSDESPSQGSTSPAEGKLEIPHGLQTSASGPFTSDGEYAAIGGADVEKPPSRETTSPAVVCVVPNPLAPPLWDTDDNAEPKANTISITFGEDGAPLATALSRKASMIRRPSLDNERQRMSRRNRAFGGFDDEEGLLKEVPSDAESEASQPTGKPSAAVTPAVNVLRRLSIGAIKQPFRSFRRQSYASPEACVAPQQQPQKQGRRGSMDLPQMWAGPAPARKQSRVQGMRQELTPFEEFQKALDAAVEQPVTVEGAAKRRGTVVNEPRFDFTGVFGESSDTTPRVAQAAESGDSRSLPVRRKSSSTVGKRKASSSDFDYGAGAEFQSDDDSDEHSASRSGSAVYQRKNSKLHSLLIAGIANTSPVADAMRSPRSQSKSSGGSRTKSSNDLMNDEEARQVQTRSEVEMHLYRCSLSSIPLQFVVQEVHDRINRDRMLLDLVYYIPFMVLFTVLFLGRNITDNFYAAAALTSTNTGSDIYAHQVDLMNEYFRMDTQQYDGNEKLYMYSDGTDINNNYYGPQNWRLNDYVQIPEIKNFLGVSSRVLAYRWLKHVFVPNLWDCNNPDSVQVDTTRMGGNTALIGAARIRSVRVTPASCSGNENVWKHPSKDWDLRCYGPLAEQFVDNTLYCNVSNPAVTGLAKAYAQKLKQTAPVAPTESTTTASTTSTTSPISSTNFGLYGVDSYLNETLFPFLDCEMTSTSEVSAQTAINLRNPCSGHYMTLPFQSTCNSVHNAINILKPELMDPIVVPQEAESAVLHDLMEQYNTRVPSNSCSAFFFHHSVRLLVVEYFAYSVHTDSFFRSRFTLEILDGGLVIPTYTLRMFRVWTSSSIFSVLVQGVVLLFVVNFAYHTASEWSTSKKLSGSYFTYLKDPWNLIDVINNITLIASAIVTALWWSSSYGVTVSFNRGTKYPRYLEHIEELYTMQVYCNAVNVIMIFIKILKFLRISDRLSIMTKTLGECQSDIISLMLLFLFIHTGFAVTATTVFGASLKMFRNVEQSFLTLLFALIIGVDYDGMRRVDPTLTPIFYWPFITMEVFLLLNFFVAILSEGFAQVSQSMNLPPLDMALLRAVDELRMVLRWSYLKELLVSLTNHDQKRDHIKALVEMHACLEEHLRLSLLAVEDLRVVSRENVPMHFRDMQWWLPRPIYEALGTQYLLILWEDMLYAYNIKDKLNQKTGERVEFTHAIQEGMKEVQSMFPDVLGLEVQAEVVIEKLDKIPRKIVEWSIAVQQQRAKMAQMSDKELRHFRKQQDANRRRLSSAHLSKEESNLAAAHGKRRASVAVKKESEMDEVLRYFSQPSVLAGSGKPSSLGQSSPTTESLSPHRKSKIDTKRE